MTVLIIVESPAKCASIEKWTGHKCIASFGHFKQLSSLKNIDIEHGFTPSFDAITAKSQQITKLKRAIMAADEVIIATDDDREGEGIGWHICDEFGLPLSTTKRIIFHEITKPAIEKALNAPTIINMDLVKAQQSRQILDLLVGYKLSPVLWEHITRNSKTGLSAGRCQTPALRLVYENQTDIDAAPGKKVYNTTGYFTDKNIPFTLAHSYESEEDMEDFLTKSGEHSHMYKCGEVRKITKNPPSPYTTSTMQQAASNTLHISPKEAMMICQKLYEKGLITYMRTDSTIYSPEFIETAKKYINSQWSTEYIHPHIENLSKRDDTKKAKKTKKKADKNENMAQEAHEAIRPTDIKRKDPNGKNDLTNKELRMYKMIWCNTVESCMAAATGTGITATVSAPENHVYKYSTELIVFMGWKIVRGCEADKFYSYLTSLVSKVIPYKKIVAKVSLKDLKSHYTEAKLVQLLEQKGIGRPSTFSSLVDKIQERGYVKKDNIKGKTIKCIDYELENNELEEIETEREFGNEKNKLVIQPLGIMVLEFLIKHFDGLFNYDYTRQMEDDLDKIAKGNMNWVEMCNSCNNEIDGLSKELRKTSVKKETIKIDENHTYMIAKFGPVIKYEKDGETSFKTVKKDIDIAKIRTGELGLDDIVEVKTVCGKILGKYNNNDVILKKGQYGLYIQCGDIKKSLSNIDVEEHNITLEHAITHLSSETNSAIKRMISQEMNIRTGKYGDYIFYKTKSMTKPRFLKLKGFKENYMECELITLKTWITATYKVAFN